MESANTTTTTYYLPKKFKHYCGILQPLSSTGKYPKSMDIVAEQIRQIGSTNRTITVCYNSIGEQPQNHSSSSSIESICHQFGVPCVHLQHYETAGEDVTLQRAYEHCLQDEHKDNSVLYFHDKGSYNPDNVAVQDPWRIDMMTAMTHPECLDLAAHDECNICGLMFVPFWSMMFPGNFFHAKCSYLRKLRPPQGFEPILTDVVTTSRPKSFAFHIFSEQKHTLGLERWAMEHWVGTHPHVQPCDFSESTPDLLDLIANTGKEYHLIRAPRHGVHAGWYDLNTKAMTLVLGKQASRVREWYCRVGISTSGPNCTRGSCLAEIRGSFSGSRWGLLTAAAG